MVDIVDEATARQAVVETALLHLGERNTDTTSFSYMAADERLPFIRDRLLETVRWNFASALGFFAEGTRDADLPGGYGFPYAFDLPADFLRMLGVHDPHEALQNYGIGTSVVWKVVGEAVLATERQRNEGGAYGLWCWYVRREEDARKWDALFRELVTLELAQAIAFRVTTNPGAVQQLEARRDRLLRDAKIANARENFPEQYSVAGGWMESRLGGGDGYSGYTVFPRFR